jgi:hypothetical protein
MARPMPLLVTMKRWLVLLAACGGSGSKHTQTPRDPAAEAADAERERLKAEEPKKPFETRERVAFRPTDRCGQGPYRMDTYSMRAKYGEQLVVYACGKHEMRGNYRLTTERKQMKPSVSEDTFGWSEASNGACKASRATTVATASGGGTGGGGGGGAAGPATTASSAAPTEVAPVALEHLLTVPDQCALVRTPIMDMTYSSYDDSIAIDGHVVIEVWSDEPNDYEDAYFVIEKRAVVADMTPDKWKAYWDAKSAWTKRWNAFVDGEVASGRSHYVSDDTVKTPPPPPPRTETQPPRPSTHARWIPGYWQYAEGGFHWLAGMWDVPEEDIQQDQTVHAPTPPPPPPVEQPHEPQPTVTAVWTPGQWQWDGRAYIWIAGAWRIPPTQQHEWKPSGWSVSSRGAVFVPGGWKVTVRLK